MASVQILRNKDLINDVPTSTDFEFSTPEIMFTNPAMPFLDETYSLDSLMEHGTIKEYLTAFFKSLLSNMTKPISIRMASSYSYSVAPQLDMLPLTSIPLNLLLPTLITDKSFTSEFITQLSNNISSWFKNNNIISNEYSQIIFDLTIFADSDQKMPLFKISKLGLSTSKIDFNNL